MLAVYLLFSVACSELIRMQKEIDTGINILPYEKYPQKGAFKICFTSTNRKAIEETKKYLGDSMNDYEMMRAAGVGIAMGNACAELKDMADHVCGDVWDDGIYYEFKRRGFI